MTVISSTPNTFYNGNYLPGCAQWVASTLLIGNSINADSYWVWDGAILYTAGTLSPIVTVTDGGRGMASAADGHGLWRIGNGRNFCMRW